MDSLQEKGMLRVLKRNILTAGVMIAFACFPPADVSFAEDKKATEFKMNNITQLMKEAEQKSKTLHLPEQIQTDDCGCGDSAEKFMDEFNDPDYQARILDEKTRLQKDLFQDIITQSLPNTDHNPPAGAGSTPGQLYLFISSSVPLTTLRNYAAVLDHAGTSQVIMVLRGFVGGMKKIRPTLDFIGTILKKDPACDLAKEMCDSYQVNIQIDPLLFQRLAIHEVPALAYLPISETDDENMQQESIIINGDAGLDYLLERINREVKNPELDSLIVVLRKGAANGE